MPIWSDVLRELHEGTSEGRPADFDSVRSKYLTSRHKHYWPRDNSLRLGVAPKGKRFGKFDFNS